MLQTTEKAWAKLNLTLDILGARDDGYHEMKMVMQSVSLCDDLTLTATGDAPVARTNLSFLPTGDKNLAVIAALHLWDAMGKQPQGLEILLHKRIPVCAGLAGGSSDAAAVLRALNRMEGSPFTTQELAEIGAKVGSDVPYCVVGGTMLAEGRGEVLSPLPSLPPCWIVLCKPDFPISTPELFSHIDTVKLKNHPDTMGMISALTDGDLTQVALRLYNVFEDALPARHRTVVAGIKNTLIQSGALGATMSGSGPTAFGIFDDKNLAVRGYHALRERYVDTFLTEVV